MDDIVEVMHRCVNPALSRSAIYRCLKRHNLSGRKTAATAKTSKNTFEETRFGFVHVDLKHLTRLGGQPAYVFVAIERTTRFAHIEIVQDRSAATIAACFERYLKAFGYPVHTVLSDNGSEFTDRFGAARWHKRKTGTGHHAFDKVCTAHGIKHKLTRPYHPQTNGMVERFNRRLAEALHNQPKLKSNAGRNSFASHHQRNAFLHQVVKAYNHTRLKTLNYKAPMQCLNNQAEDNTCAGTQQRTALSRSTS